MPELVEGHVDILAATDYFSKWTEAVPLLSGKKEEEPDFIKSNLIYCKSKKNWHEKMEEALWAYKTRYRTPTESTPYVLVHGVEAVLPLEVQIPSLRVAVNEEITREEATKLRLQELDSLDEHRLNAHQRLESYQSRITKSYNKRVRHRSYQVRDVVFDVRRSIHIQRKNAKMVPKWDGPYVVQETYTSGSYLLADEDGQKVGPINSRYLKRYYP
ncbi:hypothetical protein LIER_12391 [Lithospermum erythrorhizon]|uniref:Uncharacterized protein n=1 Tax=Lithospermum erythrorhizon TaxID=34254 RepID=A0AAV3PVZ0_LITER